MGVPTSEVGYTSATARREEHESSYGHVVTLEGEKTYWIFGSRRFDTSMHRIAEYLILPPGGNQIAVNEYLMHTATKICELAKAILCFKMLVNFLF